MNDASAIPSKKMSMEFDADSHVAARFGHALLMLSGLIPFTVDRELPRVVQIACLEDWFTNYRLLVEFLLLKPPKKCSSARHFLPGWAPATSTEGDLLKADYGFASEHVAHIGTPKRIDTVENVAPELLVLKARFLFDVVQEFVDGLEEVKHPCGELISLGLDEARESLSQALG